MDWQTFTPLEIYYFLQPSSDYVALSLTGFFQWFFIVTSGASIFGAWLAWASRKNGKETRTLLRQLHEEATALSKQVHEETLAVLDRMDKRAEERQKQLLEKSK